MSQCSSKFSLTIVFLIEIVFTLELWFAKFRPGGIHAHGQDLREGRKSIFSEKILEGRAFFAHTIFFIMRAFISVEIFFYIKFIEDRKVRF